MKVINNMRIKILLENQRKKQKQHKIIMSLAVIVVFVTTYMLILPAITISYDPICKKEEHCHSEECYGTSVCKVLNCTEESLKIHQHTEECYDEEEKLICGFADYIVHMHDENCYDLNGELQCKLPEVEEHIHTEECYQLCDMLVCGFDNQDAHEHDENCYTTMNLGLICTDANHEHTDECYSWQAMLTCGQETAEAHVHTEECYKKLVCDKEEIICHEHTEGCYEEVEGDKILVCENLVVKKHEHTEDCYEEIENKEFVCGLEEHTHTEECYLDEEESFMMQFISQNKQEEKEQDEFCITGKWADDLRSAAYEELGNTITDYTEWYQKTFETDESEAKEPDNSSAMFVSYCITKAGIDTKKIPLSDDSKELKNLFVEKEVYINSQTASPKPGDIVFLNSLEMQELEEVDRVGIVENVSKSEIEVIECKSNFVDQTSYDIKSDAIIGYASIPNGNYYTSIDGVLVANASCAADALKDGTELVIEIEENNTIWNENVKAKLENDSAITSNYFLKVKFMLDGEQVEPNGKVDVHIQFIKPLASNIVFGTQAKWICKKIDYDNLISDLAQPITFEIKEDNAELVSMDFQYEEADVLAVLALQDKEQDKEADEEEANSMYQSEEIKHKIDITVVSASEEGLPLAGAEFVLYKMDEDVLETSEENEASVNFVKENEELYTYVNIEQSDTKETISERVATNNIATNDIATNNIATNDIVTNENGRVLLEVPEGNYLLKEVKAPKGYVETKDITVCFADSDATSQTVVLTVKNEEETTKSFVIPKTGGVGAGVYMVGCVLLVTAILLYIKREKRMKGGNLNE